MRFLAGCMGIFIAVAITATKCPGEITVSSTLNIRQLGVPVHGVNWISSYVTTDSQGKNWILAVMGQDGGNFFVLQIDPNTGRFSQAVADGNNCSYPTTKTLSKSGKLYIGAAYSGSLYVYDPNTQKLENCGPINGENAAMPCGMDEDGQGRIWIGSYPTADLTCYDPATKQFRHFGRMDETDMYAYPFANRDGNIAVRIKTLRPHVVVVDPNKGGKYTAGPVVEAGKGSLDVIKSNDGWIYIRSSMGKFRVEGFNAVEVNEVGRAAQTAQLPDGRTYEIIHSSDKTKRMLVMLNRDGSYQNFNLPYETTGSVIAYLGKGPDGAVYGSSCVPMHFFRYDPVMEQLADLGMCSGTRGEIYSMDSMDGKIYMAANNGAYFSIYDPAKPYHFGQDANDNPRDLGRIDSISYKPRSMLAGPMGRVWMASGPGFGKWGGPLSWYDPKTGEKKFYQLGDVSCYTLTHVVEQGAIVIGTQIAGGPGTEPKVKQASMMLWDYKGEKKAWEGALEDNIFAYNALCRATNGMIYGTTIDKENKSKLFAFEPVNKNFTRRIMLEGGRALDLGLTQGPDGMLYGFTNNYLYQADPLSLEVRVLIRGEGLFDVAGPIIEKDIYFSTKQKLMAIRLFK